MLILIGWNKKTAVKLVELVNQGCTTVREKGKLARLRMPICKVSSKSIQNSKPCFLNYCELKFNR